jgi:hypothetical protein
MFDEEGVKMMNDKLQHCGVWLGKDAVFASAGEIAIALMKFDNEKIVNLLWQFEVGMCGVVYGYKAEYKQESFGVIKLLIEADKYFGHKCNSATLLDHSCDTWRFNDEGTMLTYEMFNGNKYEMKVAETVDFSDLIKKHNVDSSLLVAERMKIWNTGIHLGYNNHYLWANIATPKYDITFNFGSKSSSEIDIYCRLGLNAFTEKGRAMLPVVCTRAGGAMMLDALDQIPDFIPDEKYFPENSCSVDAGLEPDDGAWYWSVKEVNDDYITLYGCGGETYKINRRQ